MIENGIICSAGTFLLEELWKRLQRRGKAETLFHGKLGDGCGGGRDRKYEWEVRPCGGGVTARLRDRQEERRFVGGKVDGLGESVVEERCRYRTEGAAVVMKTRCPVKIMKGGDLWKNRWKRESMTHGPHELVPSIP